jgi:hypothetical protein
VTAPAARRRLALADDGIIAPVAVDLAARGTRPIALTRTERQLAAAAILARGGSTYHIAVRLHVSGTTAVTLAARCRGRAVMNAGIECRADPRCPVPAPAETGICHRHAKQANKADRAIGKPGRAGRNALSRAPEKELEP